MTSTLSILDSSGDTAVLWDVEKPETVDDARTKFNEIMENNYLAYKMDADGGNAEVIRDFDESAPQIVMSPQLIGG